MSVEEEYFKSPLLQRPVDPHELVGHGPAHEDSGNRTRSPMEIRGHILGVVRVLSGEKPFGNIDERLEIVRNGEFRTIGRIGRKSRNRYPGIGPCFETVQAPMDYQISTAVYLLSFKINF